MKNQVDMSHAIGMIAKSIAIVVVFGFSVTLSFTFFLSITPPGKPWFPYTALGLTEGGFILWMIVFLLTNHQAVLKAIAMIMVCACAFCSLVVAGYEFYVLMSLHYTIATDPTIVQAVSILLEVIFASHIVAFIGDLFTSYLIKPGHSFHIPPQPLVTVITKEDVRHYLMTAKQNGMSTVDILKLAAPAKEEKADTPTVTWNGNKVNTVQFPGKAPVQVNTNRKGHPNA